MIKNDINDHANNRNEKNCSNISVSKSVCASMSDNKKEQKILVVGACNVDLISYVPRHPVPGETLKGSHFSQAFGGKGANQAVQAALLSCDKSSRSCAMIGKVGNDLFGQQTITNFKEKNVDSSFVFSTNKASSGVAPIIVETNTGQNSIVIVGGANDLLTKEEIIQGFAKYSDAERWWVVTQLELPLELSAFALQSATKHHQNVMRLVNVAPCPQNSKDLDFLFQQLLPFADIVCPNEVELAQLASIQPLVSTDHTLLDDKKFFAHVVDCANVVLTKCPTLVLVSTLGARGVLVSLNSTSTHAKDVLSAFEKHSQSVSYKSPNHAHFHCPSPVHLKKNQVKDTCGAGDSFIGALVYYLNQSHALQALPTAIDRANCVAALSVQRLGTQTSYTDHEEFAKCQAINNFLLND